MTCQHTVPAATFMAPATWADTKGYDHDPPDEAGYVVVNVPEQPCGRPLPCRLHPTGEH